MRASPPPEDGPVGVYLHFPFCASRCAYCDFPTVVGRDEAVGDYLDALVAEIGSGQGELGERADTVYLGGGTPSRMEPGDLERVLRAVRRRFRVADDAEISLEGNPESLTAERVSGFRAAGVNRVSVGVQSMSDAVLRGVGRAHTAAQALRAVERCRRAGVARVGIDLIAGLPGEDLKRWSQTLNEVVRAGADHVSVYLLDTDKDTPLARAVHSGRRRAADDEAVSGAYETTVEGLGRAGYRQYEISNFARPGARSAHNLKYWSDRSYGGFGLGAHGYAAGRRRANRRDLGGYVDKVLRGEDPVAWTDPWDPRRRLSEALVLGLRRVEGVDLDEVGRRYGADLDALHGPTWERAREAGVLARRGSRVALTARGRLRSNELFADLM